MKTSEFIKKIEDLGLIVEPERNIMSDESTVLDCMHIYRHGERFPVASVGIDQAYEIDTLKTNFESYSETDSAKLWKLLIEFAATPIAEREDEPKFYVRLSPKNSNDNCTWLTPLGNWTTKQNLPGIFTPSSYPAFLEAFPEWRPFLPDYDPDDKDRFVPVEEDK